MGVNYEGKMGRRWCSKNCYYSKQVSCGCKISFHNNKNLQQILLDSLLNLIVLREDVLVFKTCLTEKKQVS